MSNIKETKDVVKNPVQLSSPANPIDNPVHIPDNCKSTLFIIPIFKF